MNFIIFYSTLIVIFDAVKNTASKNRKALENAELEKIAYIDTLTNIQSRVAYMKFTKKQALSHRSIKLDGTYSFASFNYFVLDQGGGMSMFDGVKILKNDGMLDVEALETYITENLGGVIGEEYAEVDNRITFTGGEDVLNKFTDLSGDAWYSDSAKYVLENGLMKGVTDTTFAPNENLTRAMLVTVLYRAENEPATNRSIPFSDVDMGAYYASAVSWAKQNGIVNGVTENEFAPKIDITREQITTIMHRYAMYKGDDVESGENTNILSYDDSDSISDYAKASLQWATGSGLIKDKTESTLNPLDNATRAEAATIFYRFVKANLISTQN